MRIFYKIKTSMKIIRVYKDWFAWFLWYFTSPKDKEIIFKLRNGLKYKINMNRDGLMTLNITWIFNSYNKFRAIKNGDTVVDIGAHIGTFSIFAANQGGSVKVYSYEPFKKSFKILKENIALNKLKDRVFPFQLGVGKEKGRRKFFLGTSTTFHTMFKSELEKYNSVCGKSLINLTTLKNIFDKNHISECNFLKMDCEGAEFEILYNTPKKYLNRIKYMAMEYEPEMGDVNNLKRFLEKNGFDVKLEKFNYLYAENLTKN